MAQQKRHSGRPGAMPVYRHRTIFHRPTRFSFFGYACSKFAANRYYPAHKQHAPDPGARADMADSNGAYPARLAALPCLTAVHTPYLSKEVN